jgi:putative spermidine/putrescine transport system ATP-binding protein
VDATGAHLQIDGLTVIYDDDTTAVDGIVLNIQPGEFVSLLGPSGSGKTSVLMAVAGFVTPRAGKISVDGQDLIERPPNERNLGMVFQDYALFPHMTVAQNVGFPLKMRNWRQGDIDSAVDQALSMVRLQGYGNRKPTQLSGGEQQRVALARATIFNPPVLLMDEPLGALDKQLRDQLQGELKQIQRRTGITTLYVTHDQAEAMTLSDRIAVMRDGRIDQTGTPQELYEHPVNRFVAEFVGESNILSGHVQFMDGESVLETPAGWRIPIWSDTDLASGEGVEAMIRPERILVEDQTADVLTGGEIIDSVYGGDVIRMTVRVSSGDQVIVKRPNQGHVSNGLVGKQIVLGWSRQDLTVLSG